MKAIEFEGMTTVAGEAQGWEPLPLRQSHIDIEDGEGRVLRFPTIETRWRPTPNELRRLNNGEPVVLRVIGNQHPPIEVGVNEIIHDVTIEGEWEVLS